MVDKSIREYIVGIFIGKNNQKLFYSSKFNTFHSYQTHTYNIIINIIIYIPHKSTLFSVIEIFAELHIATAAQSNSAPLLSEPTHTQAVDSCIYNIYIYNI